MNKFKNATKRIAAVAASAALVSSTAFAGLGSYPSNFVKNDKFMGDIVVGSSAAASDTTAAGTIISDLKAQFSGNTEQVKITYKSASAGGESVSINQNSNTQLNFGENFDNVSRNKYDKNQFTGIFADKTFTNGVDTQDYTQDVTIGAGQGIFEHSLVTSLKETTASDHVYIKAADLMTYKVNFPSSVDYSSSSDIKKDFQGKTLNLLGDEYVVSTFSATIGTAVSKIELIGGANKVSLGGGESSTVDVNGQSYTIKVINVDSTGSKALVDVNGVTYTFNLYETTDLAGVSVAVTDLFGSTQNSNGYATIVIGGNKLTITNGAQVKVNGKYVSDSTDFYVNGAIDSSAGKLNGISFTFKPKNDVILKAGDSIVDPLFNALSISFDGTNSVTYDDVTLRANSERVGIEAKTIDGNTINDDLAVYDGAWDATDGYQLTGLDSSSSNADKLIISGVLPAVNNSDNYGTRLLVGDKDNQYIWEFTNFDSTRNETDFSNYLTSSTTGNLKITTTDVLKSLDGITASAFNVDYTVNVTGTFDSLALAGQRMLNLSNVAVAGPSNVTFTLDTPDLTLDNANTDGQESITVTFSDDTQNSKVDLAVTGMAAPAKGSSDATDAHNDKEYTTDFGTIVKFDSRNNDWVTISTPSAQVEAKVNLVIGGTAAATQTVTVNKADVDTKKASLIADGNTIVSTETLATTTTAFDITAPKLDSQVTGTDGFIVVGGPAVNSVARELLSITTYTKDQAGVNAGEGLIKYFAGTTGSVLVYGYEAADTVKAVEALNKGGLSGDSVNTQ